MKVVNVKHDPCDIYVGRPSLWGNPFTCKIIGRRGLIGRRDRDDAVESYERWLRGEEYDWLDPERREEILESLPKLRGKILGCWCAPLACHADVLMKLVEELPSDPYRLLMRARYAYYVKNEPFMTDGEYDRLEREFIGDMGGKLPVGSDRDEDYPEWAKS